MSFVTAWSPGGHLMVGQTNGAMIAIKSGDLDAFDSIRVSAAREIDAGIKEAAKCRCVLGFCFPPAFETHQDADGHTLARTSFLAWWTVVLLGLLAWVFIVEWRRRNSCSQPH